jgi:DNA-binding response OmpR family regulator
MLGKSGQRQEPDAAQKNTERRAAMDVLLVEDEPAIRELLLDDLTEAGLVVVPATSAEEGLEAANLDGEPPAVLVTDVNLGPGMDGVALAAEAQRRWPQLVVFVMTGEERNLARLPDELRDRSLLKPFNPPRLVAAVSTLMGRTAR